MTQRRPNEPTEAQRVEFVALVAPQPFAHPRLDIHMHAVQWPTRRVPTSREGALWRRRSGRVASTASIRGLSRSLFFSGVPRRRKRHVRGCPCSDCSDCSEMAIARWLDSRGAGAGRRKKLSRRPGRSAASEIQNHVSAVKSNDCAWLYGRLPGSESCYGCSVASQPEGSRARNDGPTRECKPISEMSHRALKTETETETETERAKEQDTERARGAFAKREPR